MKGSTVQPHPQDENVSKSNLTSAASGDQASSVSSGHPLPPPAKKRRGHPRKPDPDAEVVALSPGTLMATHRFVCEACGKGFQRDQNLQLHRRGHNLPWKLKQRISPKDGTAVVRRKVYVCPEPSCPHHDPAHALGDLTGVKKHFSRKHGTERRWRCDRCGRRYAVQADLRAHAKACGTRQYRCDCGTIFSRRDSFVTHRAFCDALAEESERAAAASSSQLPMVVDTSQPTSCNIGWIQESCRDQRVRQLVQESAALFGTVAAAVAPAPHMSATALLQKAAEMGATLSRPSSHGQMAGAHHGGTSGHHVGDGFGHVSGGGNDGDLTRDFLGLRAFSGREDMLGIVGLDSCMESAALGHEQGELRNKWPWHALINSGIGATDEPISDAWTT